MRSDLDKTLMFNATKGLSWFLCFALASAGCQRTSHVDAGADATTLLIAFEAKASRIDPRFGLDAYSARIQGLVFASLVTQGPDGGFRPYLAKSWRWTGDRTCTFDLAEGFGFADGTPVRAADVVATYRAVLKSATGSPRRAALGSVVAVEADGDRSVRFRLRSPDGAFLEGATLGILPADQADDTHAAPVELRASGPYRLIAIERDGTTRLEANPHFRHAPVPIPRITIRVIPDALTRVLELEKGSIDLVQSAIDPDTVEWLSRRAEGLRVTRTPSANFQYLGINLAHPMLADLRVRRAIARAIDRPAIVGSILNGQALVATSLLPPQHWAHPRRSRAFAYNPRRSRDLLDRAGFYDPDGRGPRPRATLSFKTTTDDLSRRIAEVLAAQLAEVGIRLEIRSYDWATFFADIKRGDFHLYSLQWVGIGDPDILRQVLHSEMQPPDGNNRGRFVDQQIDELSERAREAVQVEERRRLYARIERRAARLVPYVPLWWPERVVVSSHRLAGFRPHPAGDLLGLLDAHIETRSRP